MRPRTQYRLATIMIPVSAVWIVVCVTAELWWAVLGGVSCLLSVVVSRRDLRRKGVDWHGPKTFREFREMQLRSGGSE